MRDREALHAAMEKLPAASARGDSALRRRRDEVPGDRHRLEIPIGTVMSRIARARTALRGALQAKVTPREFRA